MSKTKFSKELRQEIVEEFAVRHNGQFDSALFLKEIEETGKSHRAYGWFQWDDSKAAREYRLWQARAFANDLRVTFSVEEVGQQGAVTVKTAVMPAVISPVAERKNGGGYVLTDFNNPEHMAEHCRQAAIALKSWLNRYQAAVVHVYKSDLAITQIAAVLESVKAPEIEKAA